MKKDFNPLDHVSAIKSIGTAILMKKIKIRCPYHGDIKAKSYGIRGAIDCEKCINEHNETVLKDERFRIQKIIEKIGYTLDWNDGLYEIKKIIKTAK